MTYFNSTAVSITFLAIYAAERKVRLSGGSRTNEGRIEVYHGGTWGTVCGYGWDLNDARVVCRELGFPGVLSAYKYAHVGAGSGIVWFSEVGCHGNEKMLNECDRQGYGYHCSCSHSRDASVVCRELAYIIDCNCILYHKALQTYFPQSASILMMIVV